MSFYWHLIHDYHIDDMAGYIIRLYMNNKLYATFRRINAEVWFREHKTVVWDIKDVLSVNDDGKYIDVYCSRFD